jgi:NADPH-dependent curcumin reductase CurA
VKNKAIIFTKRPKDFPTIENFSVQDDTMPVLNDNEILLKTVYVSVDPYLRARMNNVKSYIPPFEVGEPLKSAIVAEVVESKNKNYNVGSHLYGMLDWKLYQASDGTGLFPIPEGLAPLSSYLGVLGVTGLTAYFGLLEIGKPKENETLVVSGAAGAVGITVSQIGKIKGCRVVGIAGTDEKVDSLKNKFGLDEAINYKNNINLLNELKTACPNGVDVYFDNVGGEVSDAVFYLTNNFCRIPVCGAISQYNKAALPMGPRNNPFIISRRIKMQGFIVFDYSDKYLEAQMQLASWMNEGKVTAEETIIEGFENIPDAFLGLFDGKNFGKMIVKI